MSDLMTVYLCSICAQHCQQLVGPSFCAGIQLTSTTGPGCTCAGGATAAFQYTTADPAERQRQQSVAITHLHLQDYQASGEPAWQSMPIHRQTRACDFYGESQPSTSHLYGQQQSSSTVRGTPGTCAMCLSSCKAYIERFFVSCIDLSGERDDNVHACHFHPRA